MGFNARLSQIAKQNVENNAEKGYVLVDRSVNYTNLSGVTKSHKVASFFVTEKPSEYYANEVGVITLYPENSLVAEQYGKTVGADEATVAQFFSDMRMTLEGSKTKNVEAYVFPIGEGATVGERLKNSADLMECLETLIKGGVSFSKKNGKFVMCKYRVLAVDGGVTLKKVQQMHRS